MAASKMVLVGETILKADGIASILAKNGENELDQNGG